MIRFPPSPRVIFKTMAVYYDESLNHDHAKTEKIKPQLDGLRFSLKSPCGWIPQIHRSKPV